MLHSKNVCPFCNLIVGSSDLYSERKESYGKYSLTYQSIPAVQDTPNTWVIPDYIQRNSSTFALLSKED